jgi:hypothetical protein
MLTVCWGLFAENIICNYIISCKDKFIPDIVLEVVTYNKYN